MGIASLHPSYVAPLGHWPTTPAILRPHCSPPATQMVYGSFNSAPYSRVSTARTGLKRSGRAMLERSIADEVEAAIQAGSTEKHLDALKQVTDLFLLSADGYSGEQIELFGDVLERLIRTVELRALADVAARIALAEMSTQLASIKQAPPAVVRRSQTSTIFRSRAVLTESARLSADDLVELAQTKGEQHLLAISGRWWLTEIVTDALLKRHYPSVSRRLVTNPGARMSASGYAIVLKQAESDPELAVETGIRVDLGRSGRNVAQPPEAVRARLLSRASRSVRESEAIARAARRNRECRARAIHRGPPASSQPLRNPPVNEPAAGVCERTNIRPRRSRPPELSGRPREIRPYASLRRRRAVPCRFPD